MAFCGNCGTQVQDGVKFCPSCGKTMGAAAAAQPAQAVQQPLQPPMQQQYQQAQQPQQYQAQPIYAQPVVPGVAAQEASDGFDPADIEKSKTMAGLAYLLFFLPLVACPESKFGRFHANQGLVLLILSIGGSIILGIIPIIGWFLLLFYPIAILVFAIMGLMNGLKGRAKELPLIGKIKILK